MADPPPRARTDRSAHRGRRARCSGTAPRLRLHASTACKAPSGVAVSTMTRSVYATSIRRSTSRLPRLPYSAGISTLSITWMIPLLAFTSVATMCAGVAVVSTIAGGVPALMVMS